MEERQQVLTKGTSSLLVQGSFQLINPIVADPSDTAFSTSYLGTPIMSALSFEPLSANETQNLPSDVREIVSKGIDLTEILLTINQSKNIVKTALNGRPGTVKEYISKGDYIVTVEGLIVGQYAKQKPVTEIKALTAYLDLDQSINIGNNFLNIFGVTQVIVQDYNFYEVRGSINQMAIRIDLLSDSDFKIEPTQNAVT